MTDSIERDWPAINQRLAQFGEWVGAEAPTPILDDEGAPTTEFLHYAEQEELCLDWAFAGDVKPLAMAYRKRHQAFAWHAVQERVQLLAKEAGVEPVKLDFEDGAVLLTDALTQFCEDARGDLMWLAFGDVGQLVRSHRAHTKAMEPVKQAVDALSTNEKKALTFTLQLILEGKDAEDALQIYARAVEEQRAA